MFLSAKKTRSTSLIVDSVRLVKMLNLIKSTLYSVVHSTLLCVKTSDSLETHLHVSVLAQS